MRDEVALHALAAARDDLASLATKIQALAIERIMAGVDRAEEVQISSDATKAWKRADDAVRMISAGGFEHDERH